MAAADPPVEARMAVEAVEARMVAEAVDRAPAPMVAADRAAATVMPVATAVVVTGAVEVTAPADTQAVATGVTGAAELIQLAATEALGPPRLTRVAARLVAEGPMKATSTTLARPISLEVRTALGAVTASSGTSPGDWIMASRPRE